MERLRFAEANSGESMLPRKAASQNQVPVPQTDTGGRVEYTKVNERPFVKELGKIAS